MRNLGIGNGTLSYHLYMLEKMEMIKSRREGIRYRAFYTSESKYPDKIKYRLTDLQNSILDIISDNDGISQKEIRLMLGETQQRINYNVKNLERNGLINLSKKGKNTFCYINKENWG